MSDFAVDWLALREPADARARSVAVIDPLRQPYSVIVDLGAGTGANLRWLAPRLGSGQHWVLIDKDPALLRAAAQATRRWAALSGFETIGGRGRDLTVAGPGFECTLTTRELDMSRDVGRLELPDDCLVTASALLDLVSERWLSRLVDKAAASAACVHFALSYDGSVGLDPVHADDEMVIARFNRHQFTDKGFGPALGPRASLLAADLLERAGFEVHSDESSWRCGALIGERARDRGLMAALIDGWADAAGSVAPADAQRIAAWREARLAAAAEGELGLTVGHCDLGAIR